jgi:2-polyprenyl-3-methyl-5-hydroxy-6-metoxy-1,4-benzoquinol methylase
MTAQTTDLAEDLEALSAFEFQTALAQCVDCTDYHALIGYARLAHVNNGLRTDGDAIISELRGLGRPGLRVLIAGAADAGLLALAARGSLEFSPRITVADRCATPLAVCRRYATARGFAIETVQADLSNTALNGEFDAIVAHNVLGYIPKARHLLFLRNLAQSLTRDGTFILFCRVPTTALTGVVFRTPRADMPAALAGQGIALPEDEAVFRRRIEHLDAA